MYVKVSKCFSELSDTALPEIFRSAECMYLDAGKSKMTVT